MKFHKTSLIRGFLTALLLISGIYICIAQGTSRVDTCTVNDICETAISVTDVISDSSYVCLAGCTLGAMPDTLSTTCSMDLLPTVWYKVQTDDRAHLLNVRIRSQDISAVQLSIYRMEGTCSSLQPLLLPLTDTYCRSAWNGTLDLYGLEIDPLTTYVLAVTSDDVIGGSFQICVNTVEERVQCLIKGDIEIITRSSGLGEEEPYIPGEEVSVCMAVKEYQTGHFNGCQWFQGMVPYFGSAWDPSYFDDLGQPSNATINGLPFGDTMNGNYVNATWDWFTDIGYHWTTDTLQIGDIDGNATLDLCSALYEDCLDFGGVTGGCCPVCWTDNGQVLPGGWFAYGINGSCPEKGHPNVDWGDGNSCVGSMGPWYFCFDLKVKSFPDCLQHDPDEDLRLSYYTKSDGETGAFSGGPSLCVDDKPRIRYLPLSCGTNIQDLESVVLPSLCSGDTLSYILSEPGVIHWYWNMEPRGLSYPSAGNAPNGTQVHSAFYNPSSEPVEITWYLRGSLDSIGTYVSRQVSFVILPGDWGLVDDHLEVCEAVTDSVTYTVKVNGDPDDYTYLWLATGDTASSLTLYAPYQDTSFYIMVTDSNGCSQINQLVVSIDSSCVVFDLDIRYDEANEGKTKINTPLHTIGNLQTSKQRFNLSNTIQPDVIIQPVPANDNIRVKWSSLPDPPIYLTIMHIDGKALRRFNIFDSSQNYLDLELTGLASGIYLVVLQSKYSIYTSRFVKM